MQNFIFLPVMFFMYDKVSLSEWIVTMGSYQRYYLPLFFFLIIGLYTGFLIIKAAIQWSNATGIKNSKTQLGKDLLVPFIINLHRGLFIFLTAMMIVFVLKSLLEFAYHLPLPFFTYSIIIVKWAMLVGILYTWTFLGIAVPVIRKGHSFERAERYFSLFIVKRWKQLLPVFTGRLMLMIISLVVFKIFIDLLLYLQSTEVVHYYVQSLMIVFQKVNNTQGLMFNTILISVGFIISNLVYVPFIMLAKTAFCYFKITSISR